MTWRGSGIASLGRSRWGGAAALDERLGMDFSAITLAWARGMRYRPTNGFYGLGGQSGVAPFWIHLLFLQRFGLLSSRGQYMGGVVMRQYEDLLIDALLDSGFTLEEAFRLIALQERYEREHGLRQEKRQLDAWLDLLGGRQFLN